MDFLTIAATVVINVIFVLSGAILGYRHGKNNGYREGLKAGWANGVQDAADNKWSADPSGDPENVYWGLNVTGNKIPEIELED